MSNIVSLLIYIIFSAFLIFQPRNLKGDKNGGNKPRHTYWVGYFKYHVSIIKYHQLAVANKKYIADKNEINIVVKQHNYK